MKKSLIKIYKIMWRWNTNFIPMALTQMQEYDQIIDFFPLTIFPSSLTRVRKKMLVSQDTTSVIEENPSNVYKNYHICIAPLTHYLSSPEANKMPVPQSAYGQQQGQPGCFDRMKMGFMMGMCVGAASGFMFGGFSCLRFVLKQMLFSS